MIDERAIALWEGKGDRFWDSWMERSHRNAGIRHGKGDRPFGYFGKKGRSLSIIPLTVAIKS
ncbi:hypothetical protein [Microcoleus sp. B13-B4]|uniref:hypothetical protein n=1 Tax=Microcoleus sp. B13-B4 TaxID=2818651 RepID=UPI002FD6C5DD